MHIDSLHSDQVQAAAALIAQRVTMIRHVFGGIRLTSPAEVSPLLEDLVGSEYAIAVERDSQLAGFIAAIPAQLWGKPGGYVPEYAFAADSPSVTRALYIALSARLAADDRYTNGISLWADDDDRVWHEFGFGGVVTEVVKNLEPLAGPAAGIRVAQVEDAPTVAELDHRLHLYLEGPPIFLPERPPPDVTNFEQRIANGTAPVFLASDGNKDVGYMALDPDAGESIALTGDEIIHCNGAFVAGNKRGDGTGSRLVAAASNWAVEAGYTAMALDFETANTLAAAFWPKLGFTPIVHSLRRTFG